MIHYTEIEHYIHLSLLNFYQHAYKTCMSFTDDAVISESQASLFVVILILDTHQDVSLCIFSLSITMRSSTTFSYVTILPSLSPFNTALPLLTLFIRSSNMSAMMPFFTLRSAFVTLKGLGRGTRPNRSCWVMEALADTLAVTHLGKDT